MTKARNLADFISDATVATAEIADNAITPDKLQDTGNFTLNNLNSTGNITVTGTVDGRDVAADGTKLDGIETAATADQTGAEIKSLYEAEANAFTDAQFTKLSGIEASADVTDTTNVTAAGALMDSEVTNLAQVKAFDSSDYATAAQGTTADAALPKAGGSLTGNISLGDNNKAIFGAGSDLEIYHNGLASYIVDQGTGNIKYRAADRHQFENADGSKLYMQLVGDIVGQEYVQLRYNNDTKLATTSTGIDVTGVVTTLAGSASAPAYSFGTDTNNGMFKRGTDQLGFSAGGTEIVAVVSTGLFVDTVGAKTTNATLSLKGSGTGGVVVNDDGADRDFRVASDSNANAIFLNAGEGRLGLFTGSPLVKFQIGNFGSNTSKSGQAALVESGGFTLNFDTGGNTAGSTHRINFIDRHGAASQGTDGQIGAYIEAARDGSSSNIDLNLGAVNNNAGDAGELMSITANNGIINKTYSVIETTAPQLIFNRTDRGTDLKKWRLAHSSEHLEIQALNDAESAAYSAMKFERTATGTTTTIVNPDSRTVGDFQVKSDADSHMFFIDAAENAIGIGDTAPRDSSWGSAASTRQVAIQGSNYGVLHLKSTAGTGTRWAMGAGDSGRFYAAYDDINARHNLTYYGSGPVFNPDGQSNIDFRVESDSNDHMLFVDASANKIGIGSASFNYGSALTVHANDDGGAPTSLFLRNSGTAGGSGATIQFGYTSGYGAQIRFGGNPSSYRMASTTFATVTGDGTTQDNVQISTSGDTIIYNDLGVGHAGNPDWCLDVQKSVSGNWVAHVENTHNSNGYGLKVRAGDDGNVTSFRVSNYDNTKTLLNVYGDGSVTKPNTPAFHAKRNSNLSNPTVATVYDLSFVSERFDQGNDFNGTVFTAPVTGKYYLAVNLRLEQLQTNASYYQVYITTSNEAYQITLDPNFSGNLNYYGVAFSVLADMDGGDTAKIQWYQIGGTTAADINISSYFCGHLVA